MQIRMMLASLLLLLSMLISVSKADQMPVKKLANTQFKFQNKILTITNTTTNPINLSNAMLTFHYRGKIFSVKSQNPKQILMLNTQKWSQTNKPNNAGNLYQISFTKAHDQILKSQQSIQILMQTDGKDIPNGYKLLVTDLPQVQVKVSVSNPNWTQTIFICNNSNNPIPLRDIEFDFQFDGPTINSIWGSPWVGWNVSAHTGNQYVLRGGTEWSGNLSSDPTCQHQMTIQFSSTPSSSPPTGPFVFKAAGGVPSGTGSMNISVPLAPASGLANPTLTVTGMGTTQQQVVNWGQAWLVNNLAVGSYTITASNVDNGQQYYEAAPITINVENNKTTAVSINYQAVQTGMVDVELQNAPDAQENVVFSGQKYVFNKLLNTSNQVTLPKDSYNVSSSVPGYTVAISPNPLQVPQNTLLTLTYSKASQLARFVGYFESWNTHWTSDPSKTELANIPEYVNYINLAFVKPDTNYQKGSMNILSSGLEFSYDNGDVLKQAIAILHQKHPNTKIIAAIGGASYTNWSQFNPQAVANFVKDFGLDGVDIDYEAPSPGCTKGADGLIHCQIDANYQSIIESMRALLPRPYIITVAAWSIAAYGQDEWSNAQPQGDYTGMMLPFFRSAASKDIDMVNVMSYDAGPTYDPKQAVAAYNHYYAGPISMGVEVPPEGWGGHVYTLNEVDSLTKTAITVSSTHNTPPGMMMWSLQKVPDRTPSANYPNAQMMATLICSDLGLNDCNHPIISSP